MGWKSAGGGGAGATPWQDFTPAWTASGVNPVIGNGTLEGRYVQQGDTVHFWARIAMGSTTTYGTATWRLTLPVTSRDIHGSFATRLLEQGVDNDMGIAAIATTTYMEFVGEGTNVVTSTTPFTWGDTDELIVSGTYEAA